MEPPHLNVLRQVVKRALWIDAKFIEPYAILARNSKRFLALHFSESDVLDIGKCKTNDLAGKQWRDILQRSLSFVDNRHEPEYAILYEGLCEHDLARGGVPIYCAITMMPNDGGTPVVMDDRLCFMDKFKYACGNRHCADYMKAPKFCGRCKSVAYCGEKCQKRHWHNYHQDECAALADTLASKMKALHASCQECQQEREAALVLIGILRYRWGAYKNVVDLYLKGLWDERRAQGTDYLCRHYYARRRRPHRRGTK